MERADDLAIEYATTRNPALKARIVELHQPLVRRCVGRRRRGEELEDLVQVANIGLLEALERFDPGNGASFRTYAEATMRGVLRHHYRTTWRVHVPRRLQELHLTVARLRTELPAVLGREPSQAELAERAGVSVARVAEAIAVGEWPLQLTHDDGERDDWLAVEPAEPVDDRVDALALLATLPPISRNVLYLRFFVGQTQTEMAATLGVSQIAVSRAERRGIEQLRRRAA